MKVLIADDEKIAREGLRDNIDWKALDATLVYAAKDGQDALKYIMNNEVDVLITDIRMPKLDGIGLIKNIYNQKLNISTIILSGYSDFSYAQKAIQYGVSDYLLKPIVIDDLQNTLLTIKEKRKNNAYRIIVNEDEQLRFDTNIKSKVYEYFEQLKHMLTDSFLKEACELAKKVYDIHLDNNYSIEMYKMTCIRFVNRIVSDIESNLNYELVFFTDTERLISLSEAKTYEDVYKIFEDFIIKIHQYLFKSKQENSGPLVNKLKKKIDKEFQNKDFSLNDVAQELGVTPNYLGAQFKLKMNKSYSEYIEKLRIDKACKLLKETNLKIYEIAEECGYSDGQYLSRVFKNATGLTPLEYKSKK